MIVVINQPCYLPWRGFFALMKAADAFVFYDDVQFTSNTKKSFFSRVQLKTAEGRRWLTVPVRKSGHFGQRINEVGIVQDGAWQRRHCELIRAAFRDAPFARSVEPVLDLIAGAAWDRLSGLTVSTTQRIAELLGIHRDVRLSSEMGVSGAGSQRVLDICRKLGAAKYVTGHGALNYLDHVTFEAAGIAVEYMDHDLSPYPQLHGSFDPYVTVLDVLANTGPQAPAYVGGATIPWRAMVARRGEV